MNQKIGKISIVLLMILIAFVPLLYMTAYGLFNISSEQFALINARRMGLLIKSCIYAMVIYLFNVFIGLTTALFFFDKSPKINKFKWFLALLVPLPSYLYALSFMQISQKISQYFINSFGYVINLNQTVVSALLQAMSYFPLSVLFSFLVIQSISNELIEYTFVNFNNKIAFNKILFPITLKYVCMLELIVFILALSNFSTPAMFGYETYAMDIFTTYSIDSNLSFVFVLSLPLILIISLFLFVLKSNAKDINLKVINEYKNYDLINYPKPIKILNTIGFLIFSLSIVAPIVSSIIHVENAKNFIESILSTKNEIVFSIGISIATSIAATIISLLFHYYVDEGRIRKIMTSSLLFLFVIPSSYIGISLIRIYNTGILRNIYLSKGMLVIASFTKYVFLSYLIILISKKLLDKDYLKFMHIHFKKGLKRFYEIYFKLLLPGILLSLFFVYIFTYNDIEVTLLTIPPGTTTIAITIYNYLHYGAGAYVSGISVLNTLIIVFLGSVIYLSIKKGKKI